MHGTDFQETVSAAPQNVSGLIQRERVLIVDDEAPVRRFLSELLTREGFTCDAVQSVDEAVQLLERNDYQMVLSDIAMPGKNGLQLLEHVTHRYPGTGVMMISGHGDIGCAVRALSTGAYDYVVKPFSANELRTRLCKALERRDLVLENQSYQRSLEQKVREQTAELRLALDRIEVGYSQTLDALIGALDVREKETQRHSQRVTEYTLLMARQLGMAEHQLTDIQRGALLHDIGKIGISDAILLKPAKLTEEEWVVIRQHPEIGFHILSGINFLDGAAQLVLQHHERFDGRGYPKGLKGRNILLGARIFAVVDTFDAMTSDRPYRQAMSYETARAEIIRCSGSQFDPELVECFLTIPEQIWFETKATLRK
ncbi:MAG: HD domain-containing phosphohydrolase [Acidobacteriota bacterium]